MRRGGLRDLYARALIRLRDVTYLVHDHDEALAFFVDALGFAVRQEYGGAWDLIEPPAAAPGCSPSGRCATR